LTHALAYSRGLDRPRADRFVEMYVNQWTLAYGPEGRKAVQTLLDRGAREGRIPPVTAEYAPG
jgi:1,4-dihydroxy-6-naphthoate synthase